jgi:hypothetical protein
MHNTRCGKFTVWSQIIIKQRKHLDFMQLFLFVYKFLNTSTSKLISIGENSQKTNEFQIPRITAGTLDYAVII